MDSGAFTELRDHGHYRDGPETYVQHVTRWSECGNLLAAVSQDYMCEPFILNKTGLTIRDHQRLTIERFDAIRALASTNVHILPVVQGYLPEHYVQHLENYGERLLPGMWVGVGSVCKRNTSPREIAAVLRAIKQTRPDLRLHGFGVKTTALQSQEVRELLYSADSMAWSLMARKQGRNANDWREAAAFLHRIESVRSEMRPMEALWSD